MALRRGMYVVLGSASAFGIKLGDDESARSHGLTSIDVHIVKMVGLHNCHTHTHRSEGKCSACESFNRNSAACSKINAVSRNVFSLLLAADG